MATSKDKTGDKKTMDVSRPGKAAPDSSSRPVIVTHRPMVQDPMVKDKDESKEPEDETKKTMSYGNKVIAPLSEESNTEDSKTAVDETKTEVKETEDKPEETTKEEKPATSPEDIETKPSSDQTGEEEAVVDATAEQVKTNKKPELSAEEKKRQEAIQKLVNEKKYVLPIGQFTKRRNNRRAVLILVLVAVVAFMAADLLIDANIIQTSINPPISIFHDH